MGLTRADFSDTAPTPKVIRIGSWGAEHDRSIIMSSAARDAMYSPNTTIRKGTIVYDTGTGGLHLPYTIEQFYLGTKIIGITMDDAVLLDENGNAKTDNVNVAQVGVFREQDIWLNYSDDATAQNLFLTIADIPNQAKYGNWEFNLTFKRGLMQALRGQPVTLDPNTVSGRAGSTIVNSPLVNFDLNILIRS